MKTKKNLVRSADEYTRYYGDFRGVDFSSDHTQVNDHRFAYAINMYKDYRTGEGNAIETIPGFRRRFEAPRTIGADSKVIYAPINGIHEFSYVGTDGKRDKDVIVHAGTALYLWNEYPLNANIVLQFSVNVIEDAESTDGFNNHKYQLDFPIKSIVSVTVDVGTELTEGFRLVKDNDKKYLQFTDTFVSTYEGKNVIVNYKESEVTDPILEGMKNAKSNSFVFNNKLYILDGQDYYEYSSGRPINKVTNTAYCPTVLNGIGIGNAAPTDTAKIEYEQINLLCTNYKHTYVADGTTKDYPLYSDDDVESVSVYDTPTTAYTINTDTKTLTFNDDAIPAAPEDEDEPKGYAGVVITFKKSDETDTAEKNRILKCTVVALFDKRVFLTGNPDYPNTIWYCGYNKTTGYEDCTYFGELDYVVDGVENAPITGLIPVADTLAALKNHARQDSTIYFHNRVETSASNVPTTYPNTPGLTGYGCLGACINFLDDPIFISTLGVEGIGQLSVRLERAVEHRSTLIDAKLVNLDLTKAQLAEWDGYLVVLVDGEIFLGDARQRYTNDLGQPEYEWYYLNNIGIYEGQEKEYYYSPIFYDKYFDIDKVRIKKDGIEYEVAQAKEIYNPDLYISENKVNAPVDIDPYSGDANSAGFTVDTDDIIVTEEDIKDEERSDFIDVFKEFRFVIKDTWDGVSYNGTERKIVKKAIIIEDKGSYTGGEFYPAKTIVNIDGNLFFGTDSGIICSFNFDQRSDDGTILPTSYSFDNRTIYCGVATKMDNCGIPHLNKSTIKKSTVIKTKALTSAVTKVRIRTNKSGYKSIARINSNVFSFANVDFSDFSFVTTDQTIFSIREKEKHWVEKQHWLYSDEYQKPFAVYYLAFRYKVSGRIKEVL